MPKKQIIKLTESDLHRVIKESVNNILSELDWRTCTSAALERSKRSGHKSDLAQKDIEYAVKKAKESQSKDKEKFNQDFKEYFGDKTQYIKGKGWIKESVNKILNEGQYSTSLIDISSDFRNIFDTIKSIKNGVDIDSGLEHLTYLVKSLHKNFRIALNEMGYDNPF